LVQASSKHIPAPVALAQRALHEPVADWAACRNVRQVDARARNARDAAAMTTRVAAPTRDAPSRSDVRSNPQHRDVEASV